MIAFRKAHPSIARSQYWREDVSWYGGSAKEVDFSPGGQTLAYCLSGASVGDDDIYVMANAGANEVRFKIHEGDPGDWRLVADTSLPGPKDYVEPADRRPLQSPYYLVNARTVVLLCTAAKT